MGRRFSRGTESEFPLAILARLRGNVTAGMPGVGMGWAGQPARTSPRPHPSSNASRRSPDRHFGNADSVPFKAAYIALSDKTDTANAGSAVGANDGGDAPAAEPAPADADAGIQDPPSNPNPQGGAKKISAGAKVAPGPGPRPPPPGRPGRNRAG